MESDDNGLREVPWQAGHTSPTPDMIQARPHKPLQSPAEAALQSAVSGKLPENLE